MTVTKARRRPFGALLLGLTSTRSRLIHSSTLSTNS